MSEWIRYNGSKEQIAEINAAKYGVSYRDNYDSLEVIVMGDTTTPNAVTYKIIHYLINQPHPLADMITQWARTGQPVWVRRLFECGIEKEWQFFCTTTPDWNIPDAEYRFTPFEEEV